jgi:signal transduction histidine kinase
MADATTKAQRQIESLKQDLMHAQRLAALGELAGTTAHEFNNVLMTIINYAKLGLRHGDEPTRTKSLNKILAAAERAEKITNSVLGVARNRKQDFSPTDLAQLVEDALVLLERELAKYRVFVTKQFQAAPPVCAVGNQIQQVLLNLVTNARQAMSGGGELTLRISHAKADGLVDLMIRDTGSGIPREKLPKIFDRGFTTKDGPDETGKGGNGFGLAACRDIIEAHHGRIRVESSVGKGTAFTIRLPIWQAAAAPAPVQQLGPRNFIPLSTTDG